MLLWANLALMILALLVITLTTVLTLLSVALITLYERLILALTQLRCGPNKSGAFGLLQPVLDGMKLLHKTLLIPFQSMCPFILLGPLLLLCSMIVTWSLISSVPLHSSTCFSPLLLVCTLSLSVYGTLLIGFSSVSKYSLIGSMRVCVQSISFEISFVLMLLSLVAFTQTTSFELWGSIILMGGFPLWLISYAAEMNRAPLDLAEGESELISGLNVELGGLLLANVFVGEYGLVVCLSWLTSIVLLGGSGPMAGLSMFMVLLIRSAFPRLRYDKLLSFCWTHILPITVLWSFLSAGISSL